MPTNAYSYDSKPINPEDLHQVAVMMTPKTTPFFSDLGDGPDIKNIEYSYEVDALSSPIINAVQEGGATAPSQHALPTRLRNATQIMERGYEITTTQEAIAKKNGTQTNLGPRMQQAMSEIRRDANKSLFENATYNLHASGTAGKFGGLPYWFDSANTQYNNPNIVDAANKSISESLILQGMQKVYDVHDFEKLIGYCPSTTKLKIDNFTGGAVVNKNKAEKKAGNIIDVYETSCGDLQIKIDRQAPGTDFYAIDPEYTKKGFLQELEDRDVVSEKAATAHKKSKIVTWEMGFYLTNPLSGFRIKSLS